MFNKGLTQMNQGDLNQGMMAMIEASKQKVTEEHGVIDEAIRDRGEGYTVFSIVRPLSLFLCWVASQPTSLSPSECSTVRRRTRSRMRRARITSERP